MQLPDNAAVPEPEASIPDEYLPVEVSEAAKAEATARAEAEARAAEEDEYRRFDADGSLLEALTTNTLGDIRLRDASTDAGFVTASTVTEAEEIAAAMAEPMLSLITTKDEVIALTSSTAPADTATVSFTHGDTVTPLWVPVAPFPASWIEESTHDQQ